MWNDLPVGDLVFFNKDNRMIYNPQEDITPYECAMLMKMIAFGVAVRSYTLYDWLSYIKDNKLQRHFVITENE